MADEDTTSETDTRDDTSTEGTPDLAAELAKWKSMARKNEALAKQNASAADKLAKLEDSKKSEIERAVAKAAEAEAKAAAAEERIAKALTRAAVSAAAAKAGAIDAEAVLALLPPNAVEIDGDEVKGVDEAIKALRESKPYLFGKTKPAPGSADGGRQSDKPAQWTRADLKGKSSAEIEQARRAGLLTAVMAGDA